MTLVRLLVMVLVLAATPTLRAALPLDSGVVNVRDHGALGDGLADDTAAIQRAIDAATVDAGRVFWPARAVYFPAGTYRISDTLSKRAANGRYAHSMALIGESRDTVRLRLADGAPGFGSAQSPKALVFTTSGLLGGEPTAGGKDYLGRGEGNDAYGNYVQGMTIDVGARNPGAIAIDFLASNVGAVRDVTLIAAPGSGAIGLSMQRKWPGPLLVRNVDVRGYAVGIAVAHREYSATFENLTLRGQTDAAIRNTGNSLAMRAIDIEGAAVALQNLREDGMVVIDGLRVSQSGGRSGGWIDNEGYLTLGAAQITGGSTPDALAAGERGAYFKRRKSDGFGADWKLAWSQPPAPPEPPTSRWANVQRYGAKADSGEDAAAAIRAALASGAEVVYFPTGRYVIGSAVEVPRSVRRIVGMFSSIAVAPQRDAAFQRESGMFRVVGPGESLTIEALALDNMERGSQVGIEHAGERTLVLRDLITGGVDIRRARDAGELHTENTCCGALRVAGPRGVWSSQFNSEGLASRIVNAGAPLQVLGIKVEQNCTVVENLEGARTEVLGGLIYQVAKAPVAKPAFINHEGANLYAAYAETAYIEGSAYATHFRQIGPMPTARDVTADRLPARGAMARIVPGVAVGP